MAVPMTGFPNPGVGLRYKVPFYRAPLNKDRNEMAAAMADYPKTTLQQVSTYTLYDTQFLCLAGDVSHLE